MASTKGIGAERQAHGDRAGLREAGVPPLLPLYMTSVVTLRTEVYSIDCDGALYTRRPRTI